MNIANYLEASASTGRYPLSVQSLDFIQQQILLLQSLIRLGGKRYMLVRPTPTSDGIIALDGELITVKACEIPDRNPVNFRIFTQQQDVTALGMTYNGAVTIRWAAYSSVRYPAPLPAGFYHVSAFPMIKSIRDLMLSTASEDL